MITGCQALFSVFYLHDLKNPTVYKVLGLETSLEGSVKFLGGTQSGDESSSLGEARFKDGARAEIQRNKMV